MLIIFIIIFIVAKTNDSFAFTFIPSDYLADTQCFTEYTQVAYDRIMCEQIRKVYVSEAQFDFFTKKLTHKEKEILKNCLNVTGNGYQIKWVARSLKSIPSKKTNTQPENNRQLSIFEDSCIQDTNEKTVLQYTQNGSVDYRNIVNVFNKTCINLPKVKAITENRKKAIRARVSEYGTDEIFKVFKDVAESKFLNGINNQNWVADFDWIMRPSVLVKIIEGRYKDREYITEKESKIKKLITIENELSNGNTS